MPKYCGIYRNEFSAYVNAENEKEARRKFMDERAWICIGNLAPEMLEVESMEVVDEKCPKCVLFGEDCEGRADASDCDNFQVYR